MLVSLSIRDVVLIDRLDLHFQAGLGVLTGETGAGKSILLDALGLALGSRGDAGLLRPGAARAVVAASVEVGPGHPAGSILAEQGISVDDGLAVLKRVLEADGRNRAFINDQPVSVGLLRRIGDSLVEVQGQFEQRGLLDVATHRGLLDAFGGLTASAARVAELWRRRRSAVESYEAAARAFEQSRQEEESLRHSVEEIEALDPRPGEEAQLAARRALLMNAEKLTQAVNEAVAALAGGPTGAGAEGALAGARRGFERIAAHTGERLRPIVAALDRAAVEVAEVLAQLQSLAAEVEQDSGRLEEVETRYFALRDLARKHATEVDRLASLRRAFATRLTAIENGEDRLARLAGAVAKAEEAYAEAAGTLSAGRRVAAVELDRAVGKELPPLKLERAVFTTRITRLDRAGWGAHGIDRVAFEVSTNPGAPPGPVAKIASGGELARFLLALKVVLAGVGPARTLVFDEVDSGIAGATANAVGERLERLALHRQVLVVTHSPQVGARGAQHWSVRKVTDGERMATRVDALDSEARCEEIARMLSGAEITEEARAAARRLIEVDAR